MGKETYDAEASPAENGAEGGSEGERADDAASRAERILDDARKKGESAGGGDGLDSALVERSWLVAASQRLAEGGGNEEVLERIRARMEEIDAMPGVMELLENDAAKSDGLETAQAEWRERVRESKEKAESLLSEAEALESELAAIRGDVTVAQPDGTFDGKPAVRKAGLEAPTLEEQVAMARLAEFLERAGDVMTRFPNYERGTSNGIDEVHRYAGRQDGHSLRLLWGKPYTASPRRLMEVTRMLLSTAKEHPFE